MNKIKLLYFLTFISFLGISSCSDEGITNIINENDIASQLIFKKINFDELNNSKLNKSSWCGVIVDWDEWGRASKNCDGWGLCNADWFPPCEEEVRKNNITYSSPPNGYATFVKKEDKTNRYYIEILLAAPKPSTLSDIDLTLKIDKTFELDTKSVLGSTLTFKSGSYFFDNKLGEFGGIKIYLD